MPRTQLGSSSKSDDGIALRTADPADRVALRGVRLRSRLSGMAQRTTLEQTFVNLEPRAIEAVYTFPLPESAAVCGFEVVTGDRVLTGTIEEAERAAEQYDEAIADGHGAFVAEQDRPDVFTVRVGNLKPRQAALIRLTYVCPLEKVDRSIRVAYPTTIAPRFATATATDPVDAAIDADALNPPHVLSVPYGLSIEVEVDLGREVRSVASPSHAIRTQPNDAGTATLVTFAGGVAEMDRDVVLEVSLAREHEPRVQAARGRSDGEAFLAVTFVPEFDEAALADPAPVETVFVLDCSGSMQGESIAQATAALELCLRSLSPGDAFNVCRFGSTFELMASEPLPYAQATLDRALKYVRQDADLGGTELYAPLEAIFKVPPRAGAVRQVILLTDGQVTNEPAVVDLARQHRRHNRVFSFGIGPACSAFLVKGVARATGGAAEFITPGERIDDKVLRTFARLASPMVGDVALDWDGAEVQTLAELPPVFDGDVMAVFARAAGRLPRTVTLTCTTPAGPQRWSVPVPQPADDGGVIATMWARRMIQSLEEVNGPAVRYRADKLTREQETLVGLSKEFGLLCGLTTFIAVEHRSVEERNEGQPALRRVPVQLAAGWGGIELAAMGGMAAAAFACAAPAAAASIDLSCADFDVDAAPARAMRRRAGPSGGRVMRSLKKAFGLGGAAARDGGAADASLAPPPAPASPTPAYGSGDRIAAPPRGESLSLDDVPPGPSGDGLHAVLSLQAADGSFDAGPALDALVRDAAGDGVEWRPVVRSAFPPTAAPVDGERLLQTVLALLLLAVHFADRQPLWRRAHQKAVRQFLAPALGKPPAEVTAWLDGLRKRVAPGA